MCILYMLGHKYTVPFIKLRLSFICDLSVAPQITDKTKDALEALVQSKISAAMPVRHAEKQAPAEYIRQVVCPKFTLCKSAH